jgi:GGDEF domain-containing protein
MGDVVIVDGESRRLRGLTSWASNLRPQGAPFLDARAVTREAYDELTGLHSRESTVYAGDWLLANAVEGERWACLLSLQVKHLDVIEQALGTEEADDLLRLASVCLKTSFRRSAVIGRTARARFAVLFIGKNAAACRKLRDELAKNVERHNQQRRQIHLSFVGGFCQFEAGSCSSVGLLLDQGERRLGSLA